jgi:hypothetical protein
MVTAEELIAKLNRVDRAHGPAHIAVKTTIRSSGRFGSSRYSTHHRVERVFVTYENGQIHLDFEVDASKP